MEKNSSEKAWKDSSSQRNLSPSPETPANNQPTTMKTQLSPSARQTLETLSRSRVDLEDSPLHSELFAGAAFHIENAIRAFIEAETGVDIEQADLDLSKHEFHADSYQAAIDSVIAENLKDEKEDRYNKRLDALRARLAQPHPRRVH